MQEISLFIDGAWRKRPDTYAVWNPYSKEQLATVAKAQSGDIEDAIHAAKKAQILWSQQTVYKRSAYLEKLAAELTKNQEELALVMVQENGKVLKDAQAEVAVTIAVAKFYAEEIKRQQDQLIPAKNGARQLVTKVPYGVVALISPWNFPLNLAARKLIPAIAAGNAVLLKPSSQTPLSAYLLIKACEAAGIPNGVVNFLPADSQTFTDCIMENPAVRKLSFTGSTKVGQMLYQKSAATIKAISLELGGNAPFIVTEDADLTQAAELLIEAKRRNNGQVCTAPNRVLVQKTIVADFLTTLQTLSAKLRYGDPLAEASDIGPLIQQKARDKAADLIADALAKGAEEYSAASDYGALADTIVPMRIFSGVTPEMALYQEEIFAPLISITAFDTLDEAILLANGTHYGLAAYLCVKDPATIARLSAALEFGLVGINEVGVSTVETPFGGMKYSGFGRENGRYGLEEYLQIKFVTESNELF